MLSSGMQSEFSSQSFKNITGTLKQYSLQKFKMLIKFCQRKLYSISALLGS